MMGFVVGRFVLAACCGFCLGGFSQNQGCNIHCTFRYLGYGGAKNMKDFNFSSFLDSPVYPQPVEDAYLPFRELRALDMNLCLLECAAEEGDGRRMSNSVAAVSRLLDAMVCGPDRDITDRALEAVSFSVVRIQQGEQDLKLGMSALDQLLPDHLLAADDMPRALRTFKNMIVASMYVEGFRTAHGVLPTTLDEAVVPERYRKCAYGRDIEYDHMQEDWVLRCSCDSWWGGLAFDEYLPGILSDRKRLPLFLSSSFSRKRRDLFSGEWMFTSDIKLTCRVEHSYQGRYRGCTNGIHGLSFKSPGAGASRITEITGAKTKDGRGIGVLVHD